MRKTRKPYVLIMGGNLVDYFATLQGAVEKANSINTNRIRSGGEEKRQSVKITYDQIGEQQRTVHEE